MLNGSRVAAAYAGLYGTRNAMQLRRETVSPAGLEQFRSHLASRMYVPLESQAQVEGSDSLPSILTSYPC